MEGGTRYDYSGCNDPEYDRVLWEFENAKKAKEDKEKELKSLKESYEILDQDSGEVITVYPPVKTSTSTVKCTFE